MAKKFSQFTDGLAVQSPTDTLVGLNLSQPASAQNAYWTLNSLFSEITRNITDGAVRFAAFATPVISAPGKGAIYLDNSSNTFKASTNAGAFADILIGMATVPQGGTGLASLTAYAVIAGGTTSTGNVQQVSGLGNSGQVLTSNGAGALPSWQAAAGGISGAVSGNLLRANSTTTGTDSGIVSTEAANSVSSRYNVANYASLAAAVAAIGSSTQATLVIASSISVAASLTVTGNITLEFTNAGALNISAAQVVTILGSINAPLKQIFTGSGSVSFLANRRLTTFYPQWWGGIPDSSTDSTAAGNAAINAAISINGNGGGEVWFSPGTWRGNFVATEARGIKIRGDARLGTIIRGIGSNAAFTANGLWYSQIEGLSFYTENGQVNKGVFEIDGNHDGIHTLGVQGNTFKDLYFAGRGLNDGLYSTYTVTMARQGTSAAQASENTFLNCHFQSASEAVYYQAGYNALNNTFIGGNFQDYQKHGMRVIAGAVQVFSVGFQSVSGYTQIINDGYDINANEGGVADMICVYGCRTESLRFYRGGASQPADIRCLSFTPAALTWTAGTAFSLNQIVFGSGLLFRVTTAGTSGGTQPVWPSSGTIADGSVVWTQTSYRSIDLFNGSVDPRTVAPGYGSTVQASANNYLISSEVASNYTIGRYDNALLVDTNAGAFTISLASEISRPANVGQILYVMRRTTAANDVTINNASTGTVVLPGGTLDCALFIYSGGSSAGATWKLAGYYSSKSGGIFQTKAGDPTTSDIASGRWALYKNTSSGVLSLWANDGGVMKSVALT